MENIANENHDMNNEHSYQNSTIKRQQQNKQNGGIDYAHYIKDADSLVASNTRL